MPVVESFFWSLFVSRISLAALRIESFLEWLLGIKLMNGSNVFDLSLIKDECDAVSPTKKPLETGADIPQLDTVTATFSDDGSVSSLSTYESTASNMSARRSVFPQYWKKAGTQPSVKRRQLPHLHEFQQVEFSVEHEDLSPDVRELKELVTPAKKRSFMPENRSQSSPSLPNSYESKPISRRIVSSSELETRKSILKKDVRYSGAKRRPSTGSSTSSSSVRFDMNSVAVQLFRPPQETYAEDEWVKYFS